MIPVFKVLSKMASVHRFASRKLIYPESILEHTAAVGLIALKLIGDIRKHEIIEISNEEELMLLRSILIHDVDEAMTGDIPRPTKYAVSELRQLLHKIETASVRTLLEQYNLPQEWYQFWDNAKAGKMGLILVIADLLSVVYKFWEERIVLGNKFFDSVGKELRGELDKFYQAMNFQNESFMAKFALSEKDSPLIDYISDCVSGAMEELDCPDVGEV